MNLNLKWIAYTSLLVAVILTVWFLFFGNILGGNFRNPDFEIIKKIQPFLSGIVVPLITFATSLLIIETFKRTNLQNISNNLFKLIDQNRFVLQGVNCDTTDLPAHYIQSKGKDFFDDLCERIADIYYAVLKVDNKYLNRLDKNFVKTILKCRDKDLLNLIYDYYYHVHQSDLGHYFRNLYYIVRYIDKSSIPTENKIEFIKILRSQLSNYELLLLAYNGMSVYGSKFKGYIEKYELLKSLNNDSRLADSLQKRIVDISILKNEYIHLAKYWDQDEL